MTTPSTLDVLEECLEIIHRSRKATLNNRARRYNVRMEKRRAKLQSQSRLRSSLDSTSRNTISSLGYDDAADELESEILDDFAGGFSAPPPAVKVNQSKEKQNRRQLGAGVPFQTLKAQEKDLEAVDAFNSFRGGQVCQNMRCSPNYFNGRFACS